MITEVNPTKFNVFLVVNVFYGMRNFLVFHLFFCLAVFMILVLFANSFLGNLFLMIYANFIISMVLHEFGHLIPYLLFTKCRRFFIIKSSLFELSIITKENSRLQNIIIAFSGPAICLFVGVAVIQANLLIGLVYCLHIVNYYPTLQDGENILKNIIRSRKRHESI